MPLQYIGPDGHGIIWIVDQKDDGTVIMLACSPQAGTSAGVSPDVTGVDPGATVDDDDRLYPIFESLRSDLNAVVLDVTALAAGPHRFELEAFVDRAHQLTTQEEQRVTLTEGALMDFGFIDRETGISTES